MPVSPPLEKRGFSISDEQIGSSFGAFDNHLKSLGVNDYEAVINEADVIAKQLLPSVELYPDALMVLERLKDSERKLALITTSPHEDIGHLLQKHGMTHLFDSIIAGDDVTHHKPHHEPLEKALLMLDGEKARAIMIGDSDKDIGAANNFGIDSLLFYPAEHKKFYNFDSLKKHNPTYIVHDFKEILDIV